MTVSNVANSSSKVTCDYEFAMFEAYNPVFDCVVTTMSGLGFESLNSQSKVMVDHGFATFET